MLHWIFFFGIPVPPWPWSWVQLCNSRPSGLAYWALFFFSLGRTMLPYALPCGIERTLDQTNENEHEGQRQKGLFLEVSAYRRKGKFIFTCRWFMARLLSEWAFYCSPSLSRGRDFPTLHRLMVILGSLRVEPDCVCMYSRFFFRHEWRSMRLSEYSFEYCCGDVREKKTNVELWGQNNINVHSPF